MQGVTPVLEGKPWPSWDNNPATSAPYQLCFFDKQPHEPPYFNAATSATTASGMALVIQAPVKIISDKKGASMVESGLGGSSPGTLLVRPFAVN